MRVRHCLEPVLIALLLAGAVGCNGKAATKAQGPAPAPVVVGQAVRRTVPLSLHAIGNVESVASVTVRSLVAGQILKVHIDDGADVVKGQPLFTIDPAPFKIAVA